MKAGSLSLTPEECHQRSCSDVTFDLLSANTFSDWLTTGLSFMVAPTPDDPTRSSGARTFGSTAPPAGLCLYYQPSCCSFLPADHLRARSDHLRARSELPPAQTHPRAADLDLQTWIGEVRSFSEARGLPPPTPPVS